MREALVDVAVLLEFFTRYETFEKVFAVVKEARPSKLFLYQDGPRAGRTDDIEGIRRCREIAENIDWECEVHTFYQKENKGCDPSGYIAQKWAFSQTDKCIVIEDDDVPSVTFFKFCKELLDYYENDKRIMLITALNVDEITSNCPYDYFFSMTTFTGGCWASWKRVVNDWNADYKFLDDDYYLNLVKQYINFHGFSKGFLPSVIKHKKSGVAHFETVMIANQYLNNGLTVVPTKNMVINIGLTDEATHTSAPLECLPKGYRKIFELNTYDISDRIHHPKYVIEDYSYKKRAYKVYGWGSLYIKIYRTIESSMYMLLKGKFKMLYSNISTKLNNFLSGRIS